MSFFFTVTGILLQNKNVFLFLMQSVGILRFRN